MPTVTSVPDRGDDPRRHIWDVNNIESGEYQYSFKAGSKPRQATKNKHFGANLENEIVRGGKMDPKKRKFK
jgi:hypothetical protein